MPCKFMSRIITKGLLELKVVVDVNLAMFNTATKVVQSQQITMLLEPQKKVKVSK